MNSTIKVGLLHIWLVILAFCLNTQAWAAPEYVTAWPKQVPVEKPDPIMGDKPFWELWVYSETFAKRFKGFPIEKADKELSGGMQAMVFRIYKDKLWYPLHPNYPEQYKCEREIYFNSSIDLPYLASRKEIVKYPSWASPGYSRLHPISDLDKAAIDASRPFFGQSKVLAIFADGPLDGRFSTFGIREYHPNLVPGLSAAILSTSVYCNAMGPKLEGTHFWLSLFGNRPYKDERLGRRAYEGSYDPSVVGNFNPGSDASREGYFRVPEAFYKAVLPKVTLVKILNRCIDKKYLHTLPDDKTPAKKWDEIVRTCKEVEEQGVIYDFYFDEIRPGLRELGF